MNQSEKLDRVADLLKILAHATRMRIVLILSKQGQVSVSAIQTQLRIEQSLVSHHLVKMKDKGILNSERRGKEVYYSLSDPTLISIPTLLLDTPEE